MSAVGTNGATNGAAAAPVTPPHNLEAEQSVLGALMLSERPMYALVIEEGLKPDDFYRERHGLIFKAMLELYNMSEPFDVVSVTEQLRQTGKLEQVGGANAVDELAAPVPSVGNVRRYAQIVRENALLRRLLTASYEIQANVAGHTARPRELVEQAEKAMLEVARDDRQQDFRSIEDILHDELDKMHRLSLEHTVLTGTPSGFKDLDEITGGFQPGNLIIVAARPAMGKSALVANIAENAALDANRPVALFSLEMAEAELAQRFVASQARIKGDELRKGRVAEHRWSKILTASQRLAAAPLFVDDSSDVGMLEIRAKARRLHNQMQDRGGLGLIIIDYLQLLRTDTRWDSRVTAIGELSRGLKVLARELDVPVIALSQLSRAVETRHDRTPILADLRESGCLTGDALVTLAETGERVPMRDLVGRSGLSVFAINPETWKLERKTVTNAFSTGVKPTFELTTGLGRTIRATANHRFLTVDGWRRLDELRPGDHIAVPREVPNPAGRTMSDAELALAGHLIGDGCTLPRQPIHYTTVDENLAHYVASLAPVVFGDEVVPRVSRERTWYQLYLPSTRRTARGTYSPVREWLEQLGIYGLRSYEKRVPDEVFRQERSAIGTFLRHLWATDGCLCCGPSVVSIHYATSSPVLARDVAALLLRLGVRARIRSVTERTGRLGYSVVVTGRADLAAFLSEVGAVGQKVVDAVPLLARLQTRTANTNRDVIPRSTWQSLVKPAMASSGTTSREMQGAIGTHYCGSTLYKANMSRERASCVAEAVHSPPLQRLAESDVYWDQVRSVVATGRTEEVFDLTVEGLHNFVANDLVVHNSIEQDADVVIFIYREEYYEPETTERPGEADLIIAKHRNGAVGKVTLTFQHEYPKFLNFAGQRYAE